MRTIFSILQWPDPCRTPDVEYDGSAVLRHALNVRHPDKVCTMRGGRGPHDGPYTFVATPGKPSVSGMGLGKPTSTTLRTRFIDPSVSNKLERFVAFVPRGSYDTQTQGYPSEVVQQSALPEDTLLGGARTFLNSLQRLEASALRHAMSPEFCFHARQ